MGSLSGNQEIVNQGDETENLSINEAWELKRYKHVLSLLLEDSDFPRHFDIDELNEDDEDQKALKEFALKRNLLHEWIKEGNLEKVKEFTSKKKSKYYYNDSSWSAAFTAVKSKKFNIYAYLKSIGASLDKYEDMDEKLSEIEKYELRDVLLSYFSTNEKSHIHYLMSKIKISSPNTFEEKKEILLEYLKKLDEIKGVSVILKVIQYADNLELVLDLNSENVKDVCPPASDTERGVTYQLQNIIYVAAGRSDEEVLGTLAHELTHMAMELIYKNNCDPYFKSDSGKRDEFKELVEAARKKNIQKVEKTPSETFKCAFSYSPREVESEVVARIPHILAQYNNGKEWLGKNIPELFQFYTDNVIPECEKFIDQSFLLKPRSLNRSLNETEGEILNIKKNGLVFNDVGKIKIFLGDESKKIFALITNCTWLGLLRALQGIYGASYMESYDHYLVFKLENCMKNYEDVEFVFNSEAAEVLVIECPNNIGGGWKTLKRLQTLIKIAKAKTHKKIVFILKEKKNKLLMEIVEKEKMGELYEERMDEDFSLYDLDRTFQNKILEKVMLFQGEELSLGKLIRGDEDLLKCINANIIQDLLENKKIEVGRKPPGTSSTEGAYGDVFHEINLDTLVHEVSRGDDIFIISGEGERDIVGNDLEVEKLNDYEHEVVIGTKNIFLVNDDMTENNFKTFCSYNSNKKIYWINARHDQNECLFMLLKFYNPDFYFPRKFEYFKRKVNKKDFGIKDLIVILDRNDLLETGFQNNVTIFNDAKQAKIQFETLCKHKKYVHFMKYENGELICIKSHGRCPWMDKDGRGKKELVEEELIEEIRNEKVVIFADDPGMGKSTTLTVLGSNIVHTHWVIRMDLKDHVKAIGDINEYLNMNEVILFFKKVDGNLDKEIGKKLLESALNKKKNFWKPLLIAFDGFDELLDEKERNKIIALVNYLGEKTACKIWITSRLHYKEFLEGELLTIAVRFIPVNDSSKRKFIKSYLQNHLRLILRKEKFLELFGEKEVEEKSILWKYTTGFVNKAKSIFKGDIERFIGTPLQLHLLLEGSCKSFQNWIENPEGNPDFQYLGDNLLDVYKRFFNRKCEILFKKKNILEETIKSKMRDLLEKSHEELAKSLVLDEKSFKNASEDESLMLSFGIAKFERNTLEFVHFTFREYFFAQLLIQNFLHQSYGVLIEDLANFFMSEALIKEKHVFIRGFLNEYFGDRKIIGDLRNSHKFSEAISLLNKGNCEYNCALCVAVMEGHHNTFQFLFSWDSANLDWYDILLHEGFCRSRLLNVAVKEDNKSAFNLIVDQMSKYCVNEHQYYEVLSNADIEGKTVLLIAVEKEKYDFFVRLFGVMARCSKDEQLSLLNFRFETNSHVLFREFPKPNLTYSRICEETLLYRVIDNSNNLALNRIIEALSDYSPDQQYNSLCLVTGEERTAFHKAISAKNQVALRLLIGMISKFSSKEQYKLLSVTDGNWETAFHLAVKCRNDVALERIIEMLSNLESMSDYLDKQFEILSNVNIAGQTIFHIAVEGKNDYALERCIEMLSKHDLNKQYKLLCFVSKCSDIWWNDVGGTVLHLAVLTKNDFALNLFIKKLSNYHLDQQYDFLRIVNTYGYTVFHLAVEKENEIALNRFNKMALKFTSDKQYKLLTCLNEDGQTVLHVAVERMNHNALIHLIEMTSKLGMDKPYELFCVVSDSGRNTPSDIGGTVLHIAVLTKNDLALNLLIGKLSDYSLDQQYNFLRIVNAQGHTALHLAVEMGNELALNRLLEISSKLNLNKEYKLLCVVSKCGVAELPEVGGTVLHGAVKTKNHHALNRFIEVMSGFGLNRQYELLCIVNENGQTVFHLAKEVENDFALEQFMKVMSNFSSDQQRELLKSINTRRQVDSLAPEERQEEEEEKESSRRSSCMAYFFLFLLITYIMVSMIYFNDLLR